MTKEWMTIKEAADTLGITTQSLHRKIALGQLPAERRRGLRLDGHHSGLFWHLRTAVIEEERSRLEPRAIEAVDAAYWAGFVDGEGSIGITKVTGLAQSRFPYHHSLRVTVSCTDYEPLEWAVAVFGGGLGKEIVRPLSTRPQRPWRINGAEAVGMLKAILRYLKVKDRQALLAIEFGERVRCNRWQTWREPITGDEWEWREQTRLRISDLNKHRSDCHRNSSG